VHVRMHVYACIRVPDTLRMSLGQSRRGASTNRVGQTGLCSSCLAAGKATLILCNGACWRHLEQKWVTRE